MIAILSQSVAGFWEHSSGEFLSALAGAFVGALAAYYFQLFSENRKTTEEQHGAIVRSQLALIGQRTLLQEVREQVLEPFRTDPDRDRKIPLYYSSESLLRIDFNGLSFLLERDGARLIDLLLATERAYDGAVKALAVRNEVIEELHARATFHKPDVFSEALSIEADPRDIYLLRNATNLLYVRVDVAIGQCEAGITELWKAGKAFFPQRKFIGIPGKTPNHVPGAAT